MIEPLSHYYLNDDILNYTKGSKLMIES